MGERSGRQAGNAVELRLEHKASSKNILPHTPEGICRYYRKLCHSLRPFMAAASHGGRFVRLQGEQTYDREHALHRFAMIMYSVRRQLSHRTRVFATVLHAKQMQHTAAGEVFRPALASFAALWPTLTAGRSLTDRRTSLTDKRTSLTAP